jgi:hypothetical protein
MKSHGGKGDANTRDYDRRKYWDAPLWNNMRTKAKNERIYNEGKDKLDGTGIKIIEEKGE